MNEIATILTKSSMSGDDIQQVITMIDQESANSIYRRCAEEFGFKIAEVEGTVYSTVNELAIVFGYHYPQNASRVLRRGGVETQAVSGLIQIGLSDVRQKFGLSEMDSSTKLIDYHGFLTLALEGRGKHCEKVREYLLTMEKKARVDTIVYETTGMDAADLQEVGPHIDDPMIRDILERQKQMKDIIQLRIRQIETQERVKTLEEKFEAELSITPQQEETINKRKDELIALQVQNGKDKNRAYQQFWRTIKDRFHFGVFTGLERSKFLLVVKWLDGLIEQEREKLKQLSLFQPIVTFPPTINPR